MSEVFFVFCLFGLIATALIAAGYYIQLLLTESLDKPFKRVTWVMLILFITIAIGVSFILYPHL